MKKTIIAAMCVLGTALLSCDPVTVEQEPILDYASGQETEITVAPGGGEISLEFVSTEAWSVQTVENWFEFTRLSGKGGNNKLNVKVDPNISHPRTGVIRIEAGENTLPFTITQDVADHVSAFEKEFEIDANGGSVTLSFTTTNVWTATTEAEWLTLSATEGEPGRTSVTATAGQNTEEPHTATVIVTCGEEKVEFTIYQDFIEIEEWTLLGTGKYREDFFSGLWQNLGNQEVDVVIYENYFTPGTYKIENMFASALEASFGRTLAQIEAAGYYKYVPTDIIIVTSNGRASIDDQPTGLIDLDDDPDWAGEYRISSVQSGSISDGVITFPTRGLLLSTQASYAEGNGYYSNTSGKFRITLPGKEAPEDFPIDLTLQFDLASNMFTNGASDRLGFIVRSATIDDIVSLTYLCAPTSQFDALGGPSFELVENNGTDMSNYIPTIKSQGYIGLSFPNTLSSNTDYTLCVVAVNNAGDKLLVWDTAMIPVGNTGGSGSIGERAGGGTGGGTGGGDANGADLVTGTYHIYDLIQYQNGDSDEMEGDFTVVADPDYNDGIHFLVDGIAGVTSCDWKAVYSASAGTLTLDGYQKGYEQYGNLFGEAIAQNSQYYIGLFSYADYDAYLEGIGTDPCVLTVDTKTGELNGLATYLELVAMDKTSYEYLGFFELYTPNAEITFLTSAVETSAKVAPLNAGSTQRATLKTTAKRVRQYKADSQSFRGVDARFVTEERKALRFAKHGAAEKVSKAR